MCFLRKESFFPGSMWNLGSVNLRIIEYKLVLLMFYHQKNMYKFDSLHNSSPLEADHKTPTKLNAKFAKLTSNWWIPETFRMVASSWILAMAPRTLPWGQMVTKAHFMEVGAAWKNMSGHGGLVKLFIQRERCQYPCVLICVNFIANIHYISIYLEPVFVLCFGGWTPPKQVLFGFQVHTLYIISFVIVNTCNWGIYAVRSNRYMNQFVLQVYIQHVSITCLLGFSL